MSSIIHLYALIAKTRCLSYALLIHFDKAASFVYIHLNISIVNICAASKTYCGYCKRVKDLLTQLGAAYRVIELDEESKFALWDCFCCPSLGLLSGIDPLCVLKFSN